MYAIMEQYIRIPSFIGTSLESLTLESVLCIGSFLLVKVVLFGIYGERYQTGFRI